MSSLPFTPSGSNQAYEPLPLTNDERIGHSLYNAPPDHGPPSPTMGHADFPDEDLPPGAARPRFLGAAAYQDVPGGAPMGPRHSFAESFSSLPSMDRGGAASETGSVYRLHETPPLSHGYYAGGYRDDPDVGETYYGGHEVPMAPMGKSRYLDEKRAVYAAPRSRRKFIIWGIIIGAILLIAGVLIPLYFAVIRPKLNGGTGSSNNNSNPKSSDPAKNKPVSAAVVTGGDGSKVTMDNGQTFVYNNSFGGYWYWDENDPFNNGARAQSWSPALNETFRYGIDKIRGVNLGGWLTIEPFIAPALFEKYLNQTPPAVDEWTLHTMMAADTANGGISQIEDHYKTFITEQDFAQIAAAGLNYVRIPLPFWAIETRPGEPFLPKVAWNYFLKAIQWARKYGIRINLDFHALAGSQNGWNHSGKLGTINVLQGPMGVANAQRALDHIRIISEFISQPQYKDVVTMFGIMNEPQGQQSIGQDPVSSFYLQAYLTVRNVSGNGEGKGPWVSLHDAFFSRSTWANFIPNGDRVSLDSHPYLCFQGQSDAPMSSYATAPCAWGTMVNTSMGAFGMTTAGEFSNAVTDCGLFVNGVNQGTRYEGDYIAGNFPKIGDCTPWTDYQNWTPDFKAAVKTFALASMDALQDYFFWTWKIGPSSVSGKVEAPQWSYQLGLQNGWMPTDPRQALGKCGGQSPWQPPLQAWQTGGQGAGNIPATLTQQYPWPPATISFAGADPSNLPQYTPTGAVPTLPVPTFSFASATATPSAGSGWANPSDTAGLMVNKQGCTYLDPWIGTAAPPPVCTGS